MLRCKIVAPWRHPFRAAESNGAHGRSNIHQACSDRVVFETMKRIADLVDDDREELGGSDLRRGERLLRAVQLMAATIPRVVYDCMSASHATVTLGSGMMTLPTRTNASVLNESEFGILGPDRLSLFCA